MNVVSKWHLLCIVLCVCIAQKMLFFSASGVFYFLFQSKFKSCKKFTNRFPFNAKAGLARYEFDGWKIKRDTHTEQQKRKNTLN